VTISSQWSNVGHICYSPDKILFFVQLKSLSLTDYVKIEKDIVNTTMKNLRQVSRESLAGVKNRARTSSMTNTSLADNDVFHIAKKMKSSADLTSQYKINVVNEADTTWSNYDGDSINGSYSLLQIPGLLKEIKKYSCRNVKLPPFFPKCLVLQFAKGTMK